MKKVDEQEIIESQERIIKKQEREIKGLERTITLLQGEIQDYKKEQKLRLLEVQKKIQEQSFTIKEMKSKSKAETRAVEEISLKQLEKEESAFSKFRELEGKLDTLTIENEELNNTINQKDVLLLEKDNDLSTLKTEINALQDRFENLKQTELKELRQKLSVKEDLVSKQNEAVNKLTLDIKKYEVEIAELEYKLSTEQTRNSELKDLQSKIASQEDIIIHLRKTNVINEEKLTELREQLNNANKRISELLQKLKTAQEGVKKEEIKIPFFQLTLRQ